MTLKEVLVAADNDLGSFGRDLVHYYINNYLPVLAGIVAILFILVCIGQVITRNKKTIRKSAKDHLTLSLQVVTLGFLICFIQLTFSSKPIDKFENSYFYPYIDSLEESQRDIAFIELVSESSTNSANRTMKDSERAVNVRILVEGDNHIGSEFYAGDATVKFDLKENQQPYVTYKLLHKDILFDKGIISIHYPKGVYNPEVHVSKNSELQ